MENVLCKSRQGESLATKKGTAVPFPFLLKGETKKEQSQTGLLFKFRCLMSLDSAGHFIRTQAACAGVDVAR